MWASHFKSLVSVAIKSLVFVVIISLSIGVVNDGFDLRKLKVIILYLWEFTFILTGLLHLQRLPRISTALVLIFLQHFSSNDMSSTNFHRSADSLARLLIITKKKERTYKRTLRNSARNRERIRIKMFVLHNLTTI